MSVKKGANTYLKGDILEAKTFEIFRKLLEDDRFYVSGKNSKIFRQKRYFSREREANITFDLAIETIMPGQTNFSMLTLIECKNYGSTVQVGDVESFSDKVRQVGGHKAIMVTASKFQKSALKIAVSRRIGVARVIEPNELQWINRRTDDKNIIGQISDFENQMESDSPSTTSSILSGYDGRQFTSFQDLFVYVGVIDQYYPSLDELKVPYLDDLLIEQRIVDLSLTCCYDGTCLNIDRLCSNISGFYDVNFIFEESFELASSTILGKIEYDPLTVYVNPSLRNDIPRWRFTVVHEIGHLIFHTQVLREYFAGISENDNMEILNVGIPGKVLQRMEIQANRFAACILMPEHFVKNIVREYFNRENIHKGFLFFDYQPVNQRLVMNLLSELGLAFGVSKDAAKNRLKDLSLLKDAQDVSIDTHLRNMGYK